MEGKATARLHGGQARNFDLPDPSYRRRYSRRGFAPRNPSDARGDETCPLRQGKDEKTPSRWRAEQRARRATRAGSQASTRRAEQNRTIPPQDGGEFFCQKMKCAKKFRKMQFLAVFQTQFLPVPKTVKNCIFRNFLAARTLAMRAEFRFNTLM